MALQRVRRTAHRSRLRNAAPESLAAIIDALGAAVFPGEHLASPALLLLRDMGRTVWEHVSAVQRVAVATALLWTSLGHAADPAPLLRSTSAADVASAGALAFLNRVAVLHVTSASGGGTPKEDIWKMGRDLCKKRPDHPKCEMFKDTTTSEPALSTTTTTPAPPPVTTTATPAPAPSTTTTPVPAPVTDAPTEAPTPVATSTRKSSFTTFGAAEETAEGSGASAGNVSSKAGTSSDATINGDTGDGSTGNVSNSHDDTSDAGSGIWSGTYGDLVRWGRGTAAVAHGPQHT